MRAFSPVSPGGVALNRIQGSFQPIPYSPSKLRNPKLSQIQINPRIDAPITIELGSLPLTLGLFAGSGIAFLVGAQVPSIRPFTTVTGVALAGLGVVNLLLPKQPIQGEQPPMSTVTPGVVSAPLSPTGEAAFEAVEGSIISPGNFETIDVSPFGTPSIPMRVRLSNPSAQHADLDLLVDVHETPQPIGAEVGATQSMRISLGAGETRDFDMAIPINSWDALVDYVDVDVTIRKRRFSGGDGAMLDALMFVVE